VGKKVKRSHYRLGQALGVPVVSGSQISRQSAQEGGKVVSTTHRPPLPLRKHSWYSFLLQAGSTPGSQCGRKDYVNEKISMTPSGTEPANIRLVAKCHRLPPEKLVTVSKSRKHEASFIVTYISDEHRLIGLEQRKGCMTVAIRRGEETAEG